MSMFVQICAAFALASAGVAAIYLTLTLVQLRKTLRSVDRLVQNVNNEVQKLQRTTGAVSNAVSVIGRGFGRGREKVAGLVKDFRNRDHEIVEVIEE